MEDLQLRHTLHEAVGQLELFLVACKSFHMFHKLAEVNGVIQSISARTRSLPDLVQLLLRTANSNNSPRTTNHHHRHKEVSLYTLLALHAQVQATPVLDLTNQHRMAPLHHKLALLDLQPSQCKVSFLVNR